MPESAATAPRTVAKRMAAAGQHYRAGRLREAAVLCRNILAARPDCAPALSLFGEIVFQTGDHAAGIELARRALAADEQNPHYHFTLGKMYVPVGRLADARREFEAAIDLNPREASYYFALCVPELTAFTPGDRRLATMEELAGAIGSLPIPSQTLLHFALARAYDDLGRYDESFAHLTRGNLLQRRQLVFDETRVRDMFERVSATFDRALLDARLTAGYPSPLPVFIVGMPRSGGSLVEQILASHPMIHGAGELNDLQRLSMQLQFGPDGYPEGFGSLPASRLSKLGQDYVAAVRRRAPDAARITDKAASHFISLGVIRLTLPEARIIHVSRSPLDTCLSCFTTLFNRGQDFTYDLGELGRYYRRYADLMAHWRQVLPPDRFLEVRYEAVIADLEAEARRLVAFCDLPWDPRCLAFHEATRPVFTSSAAQVRRPVYRSSQGRWRTYREHLGPLIAALGDLADDA
jgi:tetratricopeptide (TPR) repeat protein